MSEPSDADLAARYAPLLRGERDEILHQSDDSAGARQVVELDQSMVGRLSRMDALQGQAMAKALEVRRKGRLRAIEAALARIEDQEFGWCEDCGEFIGHGRLDIDPTAMRCVSCAS